MDEALKQILEVTVLGPVVVLAGAYIWKLHQQIREMYDQLREANESRVSDSQKTIDTLLTLNDKWNATVSEQAKLVESVESTLKDVKASLLHNFDRRS